MRGERALAQRRQEMYGGFTDEAAGVWSSAAHHVSLTCPPHLCLEAGYNCSNTDDAGFKL
jgi:hypothetical protein